MSIQTLDEVVACGQALMASIALGGEEVEKPAYASAAQTIAIEHAEESGFNVIHDQDDLVMLDLDDAAAVKTFNDRIVETWGSFYSMHVWRSKSNVGWHVVLHLYEALLPEDRIAIAVYLGSDQARARHDMLKVLSGIERPGLLFQPAKAQVMHCRSPLKLEVPCGSKH